MQHDQQPAATPRRGRIVTLVHSPVADHAASLREFFEVLVHNPIVAAPAGIPRTLREHVGSRDFGDFGAHLAMAAPDDLKDRVLRLRARDRIDIPSLDSATWERVDEPHTTSWAIPITILTLGSWIVIGLIAAYVSGRL